VGQLGLGDGTFDHYMIYFSVVVPTLRLVLDSLLEPPMIVRIVL
jgi:hypothetical protein